MTIADRIKQKREEKHLSQEDLAKICGYADKTSISKIENSGDNVTLKKIKRIADALGVTHRYLMGWEDESEESELLNQLTSSYKKGDLLKKIAEYDYEDIIRALDFLKRIKNTSPEIQNAIQILLKQDQSDV